MSDFEYKSIDLSEMVSDGNGGQVPRYGKRLNPVADVNGKHQPLSSGQLYDRLDPMKVILPDNYRKETVVTVSPTAGVKTAVREYHIPGGVYGD